MKKTLTEFSCHLLDSLYSTGSLFLEHLERSLNLIGLVKSQLVLWSWNFWLKLEPCIGVACLLQCRQSLYEGRSQKIIFHFCLLFLNATQAWLVPVCFFF